VYPPAAARITIAAVNQIVFRLNAEKKVLGLGVKEGKPFHQFLHPKYMKRL